MKTACQRAWLITNFSPKQIVTGYESIESSDLIIAVDAGYQLCFDLNLIPDVILGDFDSIEPDLLSQIPETCLKLSFPGMKNETDTQLALEYCIQQKIPEVIICNNLQGRFDHALALVQNLLQAKKHNIKAKIISESQVLTLLAETNEFSYSANSIFSIISLSESTQLSASQGLKYPLKDLILYNWQSRGISNVASAPFQIITLASGTALLIITPVI